MNYTGLTLFLAAALPQTGAAGEADFEAALRARRGTSAPASAATDSARAEGRAGSSKYFARHGQRQTRRIPPAGTLPDAWRAPITSQSALNAAKRTADEGGIDAVAWIEHHVGRIPALAGAQPVRCVPRELRATYTFGIETSRALRDGFEAARKAPALTLPTNVGAEGYRSAPGYVEQTNRTNRLMVMADEAERVPAVAAKLREAKAFLRAQGYVPFRSAGVGVSWRRADAVMGRLTLDISLRADPFADMILCASVDMTVPTGPLFYVDPVYPKPDWTDAIIRTADAG